MSKSPRNSASVPASTSGETIELTEIRIWPVRDPDASRVKAMASLTFNGALRVNGCRLIDGAKGMFLSFPAEKKQGSDEWVSFFHPTSREANERIQSAVVERFHELVAAGC